MKETNNTGAELEMDELIILRERERLEREKKRRKGRIKRRIILGVILVLILGAIWYIKWGKALLTPEDSGEIAVVSTENQTVVYGKLKSINGNEITYALATAVESENTDAETDAAIGTEDARPEVTPPSNTEDGTQSQNSNRPSRGESTGSERPSRPGSEGSGDGSESGRPSFGGSSDGSGMPSFGGSSDGSGMPSFGGSSDGSSMPDISGFDMSNFDVSSLPEVSDSNSGMPSFGGFGGGGMPEFGGDMSGFGNFGGFGGGSGRGNSAGTATDTSTFIYNGITYKVGEDTTTTYIPVGTVVTTKLGTETTFSRLAAGDCVALVTEEIDGETVIMAVYIVG